MIKIHVVSCDLRKCEMQNMVPFPKSNLGTMLSPFARDKTHVFTPNRPNMRHGEMIPSKDFESAKRHAKKKGVVTWNGRRSLTSSCPTSSKEIKNISHLCWNHSGLRECWSKQIHAVPEPGEAALTDFYTFRKSSNWVALKMRFIWHRLLSIPFCIPRVSKGSGQASMSNLPPCWWRHVGICGHKPYE